jgi:hypothetical protein
MWVIYCLCKLNHKIKRNNDKMKTYFDLLLFTHYIPLDGHNVTLKYIDISKMCLLKTFSKGNRILFPLQMWIYIKPMRELSCQHFKELLNKLQLHTICCFLVIQEIISFVFSLCTISCYRHFEKSRCFDMFFISINIWRRDSNILYKSRLYILLSVIRTI